MSNVYAELGSTFASSAVTHPRHCAALLGTRIRGMGEDHVLWGTDSVWYGSPQWQIEAFRRIEIRDDMPRRHGFSPLGPADGSVRNAILGLNSARLYRLELDQAGKPAGQRGDYYPIEAGAMGAAPSPRWGRACHGPLQGSAPWQPGQ